jgi:hypothetical protein
MNPRSVSLAAPSARVNLNWESAAHPDQIGPRRESGLCLDAARRGRSAGRDGMDSDDEPRAELTRRAEHLHDSLIWWRRATSALKDSAPLNLLDLCLHYVFFVSFCGFPFKYS